MTNFTRFILTTIITLGLSCAVNAQVFSGYALYNTLNSSTTYLIDKDGNIAHSWSLPTDCNYAVRLKPNGNIVRGAKHTGNVLNGAAVGGKIQEFTPNGTLVWEYVYSDANHVSHHDFCLLPNGNVILTAWEVKTTAQLTQAGKTNATSSKWPTHFIELQPSGSSASIVWEWHIWDHMIQDADASKDNFGVVADHPELMDINAVSGGGGPGGGGGDWFHVNGISYNADLNQLVFSSRYASEIFIIDHSTTTAEAASHSGGNSGKGGDFLYRWGKPSNYGAPGSQAIPAAVHDPRWIKDDGRTNGGFIQFMNNSAIGSTSAVDAIDPPQSGFLYSLTAGTSYAPTTYNNRHVCLTSNSGQGASDVMSNGNIFVNVSSNYMYEVNTAGTVVWQYNAGPAKAFRYECDDPAVIALLGVDPCGIADLSEKTLKNIAVYPNPSNGKYVIEGVELGQNNMTITVVNLYGEIVSESANAMSFDLSHCADGVYFAKLNFNGEQTIMRKITLVK